MKKCVPLMNLIPVYAAVLIGCISMAHFGSRAVTVAVENAPMTDRSCIIVDAGHGGIDGGATSCSGMLESQLNLEIAFRLDDLLHFLGYDTLMTRKTDTSIYTEGNTIAAQKVSDLKQRVKLVNETENALLISIHQNTFSASQYSGAQVFYGIHDASRLLAQAVQSAFAETLNQGSKRQCKPSDGIYLMQNIDKPGILIECGFISNPTEEAKLRSPEYQQKIVCVIASEVTRFIANT